MKKVILPLSIVILFSFFAAGVRADFDIARWQYEKAINAGPGLSASPYVELSFDNDVFAGSAAGLRDIRIIDSSGVETPYKLLIEQEASTRTFVPVQIINNSFVPGEYTLFIAYLGEGGVIHNQLKMLTPSVNFRQEVTIEGSNDQNQWFTLTDKGKIYDYSPPQFEFKKQDTAVTYPESTYKYLRVKIWNRGEERVVVTRAEAWRDTKIAAKEVRYPVSIIERGEDSERRTSFFIADLGSTGLPSNAFTLATTSQNFSREVALEGSNDKEKWNVVEFRDVIFSFVTPKFTGAKLTVNYSEAHYRYYRLTVFNKDDQPISIGAVEASGILRKAVFQFDSTKTYKIYYGNPDARYPQYDLDALFPYLDISYLPKTTLSAQTQNPLFKEILPPPPPVSERIPWLLPSVLSMVTLLLLGLITKLILQAKKSAK